MPTLTTPERAAQTPKGSDWLPDVKKSSTVLGTLLLVVVMAVATRKLLAFIGEDLTPIEVCELLASCIFLIVMPVVLALLVARNRMAADLQKTLMHAESLVRSATAFRDELRSEKAWLYSEDDVKVIESETDKRILVMVPDFTYENDPDYQGIIAGHLANPKGPKYFYLVQEEGNTQVLWLQIKEKLIANLKEIKVSKPERLLNSRFRIEFLKPNEFPCAAFHGCAVYHSSQRFLCFQYLPLPGRTWNILIGNKPEDPVVRRIWKLFQARFNNLD